MTLALRYLAAGTAVLGRDLRIFASYRLRVFGQIASAVFTLMIFHYVSKLVRVGFSTPQEYFAFVAVGVVIFSVLTSTLGAAPASVRQELVAGTFERMVVSPFGAVASVLAMMAFPFLYALFNGAIMLGLAAVLFDLPVRLDTAALAVPAALLALLAFLPFGTLIAAALIVVKQAMTVGTFFVAGISVIAGLYFPVTLLPAWVQWTSDVQPFTPAVGLLRNLLVGTPLDTSAWEYAARLGAFAAVLLPVSIVVLARAVRFAQGRGTITEY